MREAVTREDVVGRYGDAIAMMQAHPVLMDYMPFTPQTRGRLETLALSAGHTSQVAVRRQLHAAIDFVVQLHRDGGVRAIRDIATVGPDGIVEG